MIAFLFILLGFIFFWGAATKGFGFGGELFTGNFLNMLLIVFIVFCLIMLKVWVSSNSSRRKYIHSLISSAFFVACILGVYLWSFFIAENGAESKEAVMLDYILSFGPLIYVGIISSILSGLDEDCGFEWGEAHIFSRTLLLWIILGLCLALVSYDFIVYCFIQWVFDQIFIFVESVRSFKYYKSHKSVGDQTEYTTSSSSSGLWSGSSSDPWAGNSSNSGSGLSSRDHDDLDAVQNAMNDIYGSGWGSDI